VTTKRRHPRAIDVAHKRAIARLVKSKKFKSYAFEVLLSSPQMSVEPEPVTERHFSPAELATAWGVSEETIRSIFRTESGVLKIGKTGSRYRRGYVTLRIPESVAQRVHRKLSA